MAGPTKDFEPQLQIFRSEGWIDYKQGTYIKFPSESTIQLVRTKIVNDETFEGYESFRLVVEGKAVDSTASDDNGTIQDSGIGIIGDSGQGPIFNNSGTFNLNAQKDDDRSLKVSSVDVNIESPYAIFTIEGEAEQSIDLQLSNTESTQDNDADITGFNIEYSIDNGRTWISYSWSGTTGNRPMLPAEGIAYVRVNISSESRNPSNDEENNNARTFELVATVANTDISSIGLGRIYKGDEGLIYSGEIDQNGPSGTEASTDNDGISSNVEQILAELAHSVGLSKNTNIDITKDATHEPKFDLNGDGRNDSEQTSVATLAWINTEYFEQAITGDLATTKPIVSISVEADADPSDNLTNQDINTSNNYQLNNITVIPQNNQRFNGTKPSIPGFDINSPWDPISFDINTIDNSIRWDEDSPADVDKETQGVQVVVLIDISRSGIKEGDFNAYLKFVSAEALEAAGGSLIDLDGNAITSEGWYDFTQRVDEQGNLHRKWCTLHH